MVEKAVLVEVPIATTTERVRNVEVIQQVPVEVLCQVPLVVSKETIREVPQKETIQTEKLVELRTTEQVIKPIEVVKEVHHDHLQQVPRVIEVERPQNADLIRELIMQVFPCDPNLLPK